MKNNYLLRVILDSEEDVVRDIEINSHSLLTELHAIILKAFNLEEGEMASFYLSNDDWEQGEEISLVDFGGLNDRGRQMHEARIIDTLTDKGSKMIYVYDFFNLWTFFIEVMSVDNKSTQNEARYVKVAGERPENAPPKEMESEGAEEEDIFGEDNDFEKDDYWDENDF